MTISSFADVCIGLMLLYFLLSLLCTTLNELIQNALRWRAKSLSGALQRLIDDDQLRDAFFSHGIIKTTESSARGGAKSNDQPARMSYLDSRSFASALLDSLTKMDAAKRATIPSLADIEKVVVGMNDSAVKDVLLTCLSDARSDIEIAKANVARWFDSAMDRLSGNYKRSAQLLSLCIGAALALALNEDSLSVAKNLWRDQSLRTEVLGLAVKTVEAGRDKARCVAQNGGAPAQTGAATADQDPIIADAKCLVRQANDVLTQARAFPIGWQAGEIDEARQSGIVLWLLLKILGIAWTAAALTLGATFWFDMLQKVIGLRSAGPKPSSLSGAKPGAA